MDESDASITFDNKGFCDHCRTYYETTLPAWNLQKGNKKKLEVHPSIFLEQLGECLPVKIRL